MDKRIVLAETLDLLVKLEILLIERREPHEEVTRRLANFKKYIEEEI